MIKYFFFIIKNMTKVLVFDVETTGLPKKWKPSIDELDMWPFIVQISWIVYDTDATDLITIKDYIIKLENIR